MSAFLTQIKEIVCEHNNLNNFSQSKGRLLKSVRLNNGVMMPAIGFGVYQIPQTETERVVSDALEVGYRMIDTAQSYFNEQQVGDAIKHSGLKREDLFITTKA